MVRLHIYLLPFRSVHDKVHWDGAIKFLSENLTEKIDKNDATLKEMVGPGWYERWTRWRSCTPEQRARSMARVELEKILAADTEHGPHLAYEEVMLLYCTVLYCTVLYCTVRGGIVTAAVAVTQL